ncbi:hypothetical protein ELBI_51 [Anabaena phage Elbi]|nr:hypothetical protein ELBI_51 [Anabaena phage Elbi]
MEEQKTEQEQIKITMDTKGFLKIEGKISPQSKEIISQAMQQAEYYRLKSSQESKSIDEQTTVITIAFMLLLSFMVWSVSSKVINSLKTPVNNYPPESINYVR